MDQRTKQQKHLVAGALGFGLAFAVNAIIIILVTRLQPGLTLARLVNSVQIFDQLLVVLGTNLILLGLEGALTGWIGSKVLGRAIPDWATKRFWRRTAVSFGATQAIVVIPLLLFTALIGYYEKDLSRKPFDMMALTATYAIVYGLTVGLFLGFLTVNWRQAWRIIMASIFGFGLGGFLAGFFVWLWLANKLNWIPNEVLFVLTLTTFGLFGGLALAAMYKRVISIEAKPEKDKLQHIWIDRLEKILAGILIVYLLFGLSNAILMLQVEEAPLNTIISLPTIGTHFSNPEQVSNVAAESTVFAAADGQPFLAWVQENDVYYSWQTDDGWSPPVKVSQSATQAENPQGSADLNNQANLVWVEAGNILFSHCAEAECTTPIELSVPDCASDNGRSPAIAIDPTRLMMVAWGSEDGQIAFATWNGVNDPTSADAGCIDAGQNPRLTTTGSNAFQVVFDTDKNEVRQAQFNGSWQASELVGSGHSPEIFADASGQTDIAWCDETNQLVVLGASGEQTAVNSPPCQTRPGLARDGQNQLHLVWYADQVTKNSGTTDTNQPYFYESILTQDGWSDPAIVAASPVSKAPSLAAANGSLHLAWNNDALAYAVQTPYTCAEIPPQTEAGKRVLEALSQPQFHPSDQPVPYCQNRYDALLFTPNPNPAFSDQQPRVNSAFEYMGDLIETAKYEALFATMQWVPDDVGESPGLVIADSVANLYQKVKADPSAYPRGMTVRIIVGNMPDFNVFKLTNQVWSVLADLRDAGVTEMVNEEIGWRVEVANYSGLWPHSHAKLIVIDGKTAVSKGINVSYLHYPIDNPTGQGLSMVDYGMVATGPVAQHSLAAFDDLWHGSHEVVCDNMNPLSDMLWLVTCDRKTAVTEYTPETLKFYIPEEANDIVFSQYRSHVHFASDEAVMAALSTAKQSLDIFEVNFSLDFTCEVGIVFIGICDYETHALPFMRTLMDVIETNHIPVRIMVEEKAMDGMENKVAIQAFEAELEKRGLSEYVDIHFYNGKMHAKGFVVDDEFLVVGSQNFHYSSWGDAALNEYNLSTENAEAIQTYKDSFEYYWADSTPAADVMNYFPEDSPD